MAFTRTTVATNNISSLADKPNQDNGLTSAQLKALWDKYGEDNNDFLNDVLIDELESTTDGSSGAKNIGLPPIANLGNVTNVEDALKAASQLPNLSEVINARTDNEGNTETNLSNRLSKMQYFVNVKSFGAKGDGVTNDTTAIQAAHDSCNDGGKLLIPEGTYLAENLYFYKNITIVCDGTLKPLSTNTPAVLIIGKSDKSIVIGMNGNIKIDSGSNWHTYTGAALKLINANEINITIDLCGMTDGLLIEGDGQGSSYNQFMVRKITNCKTSIRTIAINLGWTNQNFFIGGRYTNNSGFPDYNGVVFFDIGSADSFIMDSNYFINPAVEGQGKFAIIRGQGHKFLDVRAEITGGTYVDDFIEFTSGSLRNRVEFLYDTFTSLGVKTFTTSATRTAEGRFLIPDTLGDLRSFFSVGKHISCILDDSSYLEAYIIASTYSVGNGTTIYLSKDIPSGRIITGIKTLKYKDLGSQNEVKSFKGFTYGNGSITNTVAPHIFFNNVDASSILASNGSTTDIALLINYLGAMKSKMDFAGNLTLTGRLSVGASTQADVISGNGSPEGSITAVVGSMYLRKDGSANTCLYIKESGTGNTGWVPK